MSSFFKRFCAHTVSLSTPNLAPGYHWSMPPMEAPGHSWVSLGQSLVGHCSFLLPILHKFIENIYSLELWIRPGPCLQAIWSIQISFSSKFMYKTFIRPDTQSHWNIEHICQLPRIRELCTFLWGIHPYVATSSWGVRDWRSCQVLLQKFFPGSSLSYSFFFFFFFKYIGM